MNRFQITGLVRSIEPDAAFDFRVLLQYAPVRSIGAERIEQVVPIRVPAHARHLLDTIRAGDVVLVTGRAEGLRLPGDPGFGLPPHLSEPNPLPELFVQLVARRIVRVAKPTPASFEGVLIDLNDRP